MKDSILVFGGGTLQLSIINRAKLLGYYTIVIDPDAKAPGSKVADLFFEVAGNDFNTTKQIAIDYNVKGIVTAATDKPILMMARVAENLNLPFPSYQSCETVLDKAKFKSFLQENNLPHAKGGLFEENVDLSSLNFQFPLITKPVMNSGSRGVIKCNNEQDLKFAIIETLEHCKNKRFLIEEFIEGDEISVETLVQNNKVHVLQLTDKIVTSPPYNVELGHIQPSKYTYLKANIEKLLQQIIDKLGLNNCALHPELKINGANITILEIGPRLGGDFITSDLVPLSTGVNMEEQIIRIAVGKPVNYKIETKASLVSYLNLREGIKVRNLISDSELKNNFPEIVRFHFDLNVGDEIKKITNSLDRYGQIVLSGTNVVKLEERKTEIVKYIEQKILQ